MLGALTTALTTFLVRGAINEIGDIFLYAPSRTMLIAEIKQFLPFVINQDCMFLNQNRFFISYYMSVDGYVILPRHSTHMFSEA